VKSTDFADVYRKHGAALIRFAATIVGPDRADDVVATAVLSVMGRVIDNPSPEVPQRADELRPYLYKAVANAGAKEWRTVNRRARRLALSVARHGPPPSHGVDPEPDPRHEEITAALTRLSPRQRAVIHLAYWEDLTAPAIAERLDLSEGSVRRHLARGRSALRAALEPTGSSQTELSEYPTSFGGSQ